MARQWTEQEWALVFEALPPIRSATPTWDQLRLVGRQISRSPDAVLGVWEDAERYLRGAQYGEASPRLRAYLDRSPWRFARPMLLASISERARAS